MPIFTEFAGLAELWPQKNDLKIVFQRSIPQVTLPWQPILWAKFRPNPQNWVRVTFGRWRRTKEVQVLRWTQVDQLTVINRQLGGQSGGLQSGSALHLFIWRFSHFLSVFHFLVVLFLYRAWRLLHRTLSCSQSQMSTDKDAAGKVYWRQSKGRFGR